jgi:hypothetical protein
MNNHETILRMIEEVDPKDEKALREIDARVHLFIKYPNAELRGIYGNFYSFSYYSGEYIVIIQMDQVLHFTTSRDAIKSIRPDEFHICEGGDDFATGRFINGKSFHADGMATEELAELHATIQAIAYERQKGHDDETRNAE